MICMYWHIHSFLVSLCILWQKYNLSLSFGGVNSEIVPGDYWLLNWSTYNVLLSKLFDIQSTFYSCSSLVFFLKPINLEDLSLLPRQSSFWICALTILLTFSGMTTIKTLDHLDWTLATNNSHLILPSLSQPGTVRFPFTSITCLCHCTASFSMGCGLVMLPGLSSNF